MCKDYVKYKSFDELPDELKEKFKSGAKGVNLNRAKEGYVDFVNKLNECGDKLVGDYVGVDVKTYVEFGKCGHVTEIQPNNYKNRRGCTVCSGRQVRRGVNDLATTHPHLLKEWHSTNNSGIVPHNVTQGSGKKFWWQCDKGHEWEATVANRVGGRGCPYCSNKKVLKGYNDLATTNPQFIKYFANIKDAYTHTYSSSKKVELKCPDCGYIKNMSMNNLTKKGFSCEACSDGVSYPEKLMTSILTMLNIDFIKQISYDGGKHRYDFYLPKYNVVLETHGVQHYEQSSRSRSLEEEQENDKYKRQLAIEHGILEENYYEIDCRYSTIGWCRPNIEKTLSNYIDMSVLTGEGWKQADIQAQKSLKIEVCKYWMENKETDSVLTTQQVAEVFGIDRGTVRGYLKWGNTNGFCTYNGKEELAARNRRNSTFVYLVKPNGDKWFDEPVSMNKLERQTGITGVGRKVNKGALRYSNSAKYDPKYIGSRIVSAEVYDNQIQSNQNT